MTSEIKDILENMTTAAPEMEDYIGEDGLLYCGKCHTPKEVSPSRQNRQEKG